jgi:hypothetical protein
MSVSRLFSWYECCVKYISPRYPNLTFVVTLIRIRHTKQTHQFTIQRKEEGGGGLRVGRGVKMLKV